MTFTEEQIHQLIDRGALFVVNHSGGKDSQAMFIKLSRMIPKEQLLVIHAHLPEVEWQGTLEHIRDTIGNMPLIVTRAKKTFFEMVERRGMWPSPKYRQCTSDLKRGPIEREIRRYLKKHKQYDGLIVNCMGLRAEESPNRAKATSFKFNERNSKAGREWYDWLPVHELTKEEVFETIASAGQQPHWAYGKGMSRLSCCFCIMGNPSDTKIAARENPKLFQRYVDMEQKIGQSFFMPTKKEGRKFLPDIVQPNTGEPQWC